jgi:hypothetical protein
MEQTSVHASMSLKTPAAMSPPCCLEEEEEVEIGSHVGSCKSCSSRANEGCSFHSRAAEEEGGLRASKGT